MSGVRRRLDAPRRRARADPRAAPGLGRWLRSHRCAPEAAAPLVASQDGHPRPTTAVAGRGCQPSRRRPVPRTRSRTTRLRPRRSWTDPAASPARCRTATRTCSCGPITDAQVAPTLGPDPRWRRRHGHSAAKVAPGHVGPGRDAAGHRQPGPGGRTRRPMPSSPRRCRACSCRRVDTWWASPVPRPPTAGRRLTSRYQFDDRGRRHRCRRAATSSPTMTSPRRARSTTPSPSAATRVTRWTPTAGPRPTWTPARRGT